MIHILEKGEKADPLWGCGEEIITDEMIEALQQGKRLYITVNDEYAVVIKKDGKRKTDKPEATDTDTISRQAVLDALQKHFNPTGAELSPDLASVLAGVGVVINTMPSAPQRTGRWIPQDHNNITGMISTAVFYYPKCSECGHSGNYDMNFCPNCGARMEGEE